MGRLFLSCLRVYHFFVSVELVVEAGVELDSLEAAFESEAGFESLPDPLLFDAFGVLPLLA